VNALGPIGLVGKIPAHNEFVRLGPSGEPLHSFDAWLTESVEWASARGGDVWPEAYERGQIHAFVFRPPGDGSSCVIGAMGPSFDGAGRRFPAAVVAPLSPSPALQAAPASLPILLEEYWYFASNLVVESRTLGLGDLEQRLRSEGRPHLGEPTEAVDHYRDWAASLAIGDLWALVFGDSSSDQPAHRMRWLIETIRPYRGVERPQTPLTLRLPLGRAGGASVCFWIDLVGRLAGWKSTIPSFFWSHDGEDGNMLLHLGNPPRATVAELWSPTQARDEVCDLTQIIRPEQLAACPPPTAALQALLSNLDSAPLALLDWAGSARQG
jgi:type VI secretion system ImpM family protein